ncbi:MGDG synthase family glycosyltransferase [Paenibacillus senegalensis]|uniref:MGDG synthase family glycosyltransferase n=1 Tax=Paenibacillus senegalensis TaxID=1465766 RepID=UPI00028995D2|nr:glycosyltransferase [Paenibacillus senegalensis]
MTQESKVIILTASYGEGHNQVSLALKTALERRGIHAVKIIDLFHLSSPPLDRLVRLLYKYSATLSIGNLNYYGLAYYWTRCLPHDHRLAQWMNSWGKATLLKLIAEEKPQMLVYTFPFGPVPDDRKNAAKLATAAVVTDYSVHNRWLYSRADHYYVPTFEVKQYLVEQGLVADRITVSGIPVREAYYAQEKAGGDESANEAVRGLNTGGSNVVLIMAEMCITTSQLNGIIRKLLSIENICIHVVCGWQKRREQRLNKVWGTHSRIRIEGYTDELHRLMKQAYCLVTKAGAITLTEAAHAGIPLILFKPFPGQEKENAVYFEKKGAALLSHTAEQLVACVQQLVCSPSLRQAILRKQQALARCRASDHIVDHLLTRTRELYNEMTQNPVLLPQIEPSLEP